VGKSKKEYFPKGNLIMERVDGVSDLARNGCRGGTSLRLLGGELCRLESLWGKKNASGLLSIWLRTSKSKRKREKNSTWGLSHGRTLGGAKKEHGLITLVN